MIISYAPTNTLIVTDVYSNIKRLMRIIDAIDVPGTGREILMLPIEHSNAEDIVSIVNSVFGQGQSEGRFARDKITAVADRRTNLLIVQASEPDTERVRQLVKTLDKEMPKGKEKINVYYLENAKAEDLVGVLQELPASQEQQEGKKQAPIVSEAVQVTADQATNSLIIRAEKDDYEVLKSVIEKLDVPRAMVYIEALIMEVSVEVNDTNTVVIGGLIDESLTKTEYRVPCLGGVPLIGWLFKSLSDSSDQTNLFVFITPRVMAAPDEAAEFYKENKEKFQTVPEETIKLYGQPQNKDARSANEFPLTLPKSGTGPEADQPETDPTAAGQYTVKKNDTLYSIARRHNIGLDTLLEINGLTEDSVIRPGDRLTVSP